MFRVIVAVTAAVLCTLGLSAVAGQSARAATVPVVTGVSPDTAAAIGSTPVTITGSGFTGATRVLFSAGINNLPAPTFTVTFPSTVVTLGGQQVTISGTGFTGASAVSFGTVAAASLTVSSDSFISAVVPAGAVGIDDVTVTTPGGTSAVSAADQYVYHPTCTTTITGAHSGQVTVSSGLTCLVDATQAGPVTVTGLRQSGTLTLENDTAGVTLDGSQLNGRAYVEDNAATAPAVITVSGNTLTGSLYCTGNNPAPADNGSVSTVSGTATDQCAGIAER